MPGQRASLCYIDITARQSATKSSSGQHLGQFTLTNDVLRQRIARDIVYKLYGFVLTTFSDWSSPGVSLAYWLEYRYASAGSAGSVPVHGVLFLFFYNAAINV